MSFDCIFTVTLLSFIMRLDPKNGIRTGPVPSPCVSLCQIDAASQLCQGCLRTLDEIVAWGSADDAVKLAVWAEIRKREQSIDFD
jgi:predicted Fe-S protein YdhL (DUF1289 family)